MAINLKSQAFYGDFVVSVLIFIVILVAYFTHITNIPNQESGSLDSLIADAKTISSSLISGGYPSNWKTDTAVRIGIVDAGNRVNNAKFSEFAIMNYSKSKRLLGTTNEYFLFFENESKDVQNVEGYCGTGSPLVNLTYDIKSAYYYKGPGEEDYLKSFMEGLFAADVYCEDNDDCPGAVLDDLIANINNYDLVAIEAPEYSGGEYNQFKDPANSWANNGGFLLISGELVSGQKKGLVGARFEKAQGLSSSQERATVVNEDEILDFELGAGLTFNQGFTVEDDPGNPDAVDFKDIARFNCTSTNRCDIEFDDILDNKIAIARWNYGNGNVFFFSDFDANYFNGNFQDVVEAAIREWLSPKCSLTNVTSVKKDKLVRVDRLLIYNSDIVKMVLYIWD